MLMNMGKAGYAFNLSMGIYTRTDTVIQDGLMYGE